MTNKMKIKVEGKLYGIDFTQTSCQWRIVSNMDSHYMHNMSM
jgi:hypothetical protein